MKEDGAQARRSCRGLAVGWN